MLQTPRLFQGFSYNLHCLARHYNYSLHVFKFFICCQIKTNLIASTKGENISNNVRIFAITFMPQGTNRIWYLTIILSHNNLFVPHWHYTLIYGLPVQNVTFLSETKYTWIVHFTWPTIYLSTLYDRFEFKILITIYIIERYLISKIPSTVIWYRFQQDITYRDLFIFHYFRYLNLFQDFMNCYVNVLFYSTCLIIMTILIICSFLL